jgi:hypothetical protein
MNAGFFGSVGKAVTKNSTAIKFRSLSGKFFDGSELAPVARRGELGMPVERRIQRLGPLYMSSPLHRLELERGQANISPP